jgi:hypothetical protein
MTPAPVYVLAAVRAVLSTDWAFAKWCHHQAVLARVSALLDDGHAVDLAELTAPLASVHALRVRLDADERIPQRRATK